MPRIGLHSSGGSFSHSRGGSSSGRIGGGGSNHYRPRGPRIHIYFGRRYYGNSDPAYFRFTFMAILLFFSLILWLAFAGIGGNLKTIQNDFNYYQELAQTGTAVKAKVIKYESYQEYKGTIYYYITFDTDYNGFFSSPFDQFETTATYTAQEAQQIFSEGTILVKTNGSNAIQANFNIETDKEYAYRVDKVNRSRTIVLVIAIGLTVGAGLLCISGIKQLKKNLKPAEDGEFIDSENTNTTSKENNVSYCAYCGTKVFDNISKCPNCGARLNR